MYEFFIAPFYEFGFMARGLLGALFIALSASSLGVFLILRRMSLVADSMSHAILPGVAAGFLIAGMSMGAMLVGGFVMGLLVAVVAGMVARATKLKEESSFAGFYLISLGLGVILVSIKGTNMDLLHVLFGSVLTLDEQGLLFIMAISSISIIVLFMIYRPLIIDCLDPTFLRAEGGGGQITHIIFLLLLVANLLAGFQVLGTLMVVGMMILPALSARFLGRTVGWQIVIAVVLGMFSSYIGMVLSYHINVPTSASIILSAGVCYILALFLGPHGGLIQQFKYQKIGS
mgnify:CR=1 FL=1